MKSDEELGLELARLVMGKIEDNGKGLIIDEVVESCGMSCVRVILEYLRDCDEIVEDGIIWRV